MSYGGSGTYAGCSFQVTGDAFDEPSMRCIPSRGTDSRNLLLCLITVYCYKVRATHCLPQARLNMDTVPASGSTTAGSTILNPTLTGNGAASGLQVVSLGKTNLNERDAEMEEGATTWRAVSYRTHAAASAAALQAAQMQAVLDYATEHISEIHLWDRFYCGHPSLGSNVALFAVFIEGPARGLHEARDGSAIRQDEVL